MDTTPNLNLPIPNADAVPATKIREEFPRLADALMMLDAIIFALQGAVAGKAAADHTQAISTIVGLTEALAAKMPANTTFSLDNLTDVQGATDALVNYVLVKKASGQWEPSTALAALGIHNHSISEVVGLTEQLLSIANEFASASDALAKRVRTDAPMSLTAAQRGQARANIGGGVLSGFRNKLINGDGAINQRKDGIGFSTVADNTYWCDRHYILTQTAPITPTIITDAAADIPHMMRLSQSQAAAQRMGNAQALEASVAMKLRGKTVTLGGKIRCSSSQPIRFAILQFGGTTDNLSLDRDFVLNWTNASYASGAFFNAAPWIVPAAVGVITPAANVLTDFSLVATLGTTHKNLMVFCWTEGVAAQNVTLDMIWNLVEGDASVETFPYEVRHPQQELALCQRYFEFGEWYAAAGVNNSSIIGSYYTNVPFKVTKRAVPTISGTNDLGTFATVGITINKASLGRSNVVANRNDSGTFAADAEL